MHFFSVDYPIVSVIGLPHQDRSTELLLYQPRFPLTKLLAEEASQSLDYMAHHTRDLTTEDVLRELQPYFNAASFSVPSLRNRAQREGFIRQEIDNVRKLMQPFTQRIAAEREGPHSS